MQMNKEENILLAIPLGILTENFFEWLFHRYVLHGLGKKKDSWWSFHWHGHHKVARKNKMIDPDYQVSVKEGLASKESLALLIGGVLISPLFRLFPVYTTTIWISGVLYFVLHRKAHLDSTWAEKWLPWHWRHHMEGNQQHNWNVTLPISDWILGTDKKEPV